MLKTRVWIYLGGIALTFLVVWLVWRLTAPPLPTFLSPWEEYDLSFHDALGRRLSPRNGPLKMLLDPFVVYRTAPNQRTPRFTVNALGFRGPAPDLEKPVVMVLGGSAAFGFQLPDDEATFTAHLARRHPDHAVINAGVAGYLSGQELGLMVHLLDRYRPQAYLVVDGWNDLFDAVEAVRPDGPLGVTSNFLGLAQRLAEYQALQADGDTAAAPPIPHPRLNAATIDREAYLDRVAATYTANLDRMAAFARGRGARFAVVFQPELGRKAPRTAAEDQALARWNKLFGYLDVGLPDLYRALVARAAAFCRERGITFVDLNTAPSLMQASETLFYDPCHPNEAGHARVAAVLDQVLGEVLFAGGGSAGAAPSEEAEQQEAGGE